MADDDAGSSQDNSSQDNSSQESSQDNSSQDSSSQDNSSQDASTSSSSDAGTSTQETSDPAVPPDSSDAACVESSSNDANQSLSESAADGSDAGAPSCPGSETGDLAVTVTDSATGQPISGADVQISGPTSAESGTDGSGNANFTGIPAGSYSIAVTKDGYSNGSGNADVGGNQSNTATVSLTSTAPATGDLGVTVTDSSTGQPISGAQVTLSGAGSGSAATDDSGTATFSGIAAGDYSIAVTKDGYSDGSGSGSVPANQSSTASVALTSTAPATGDLAVTVTDSATSKPISGAHVELSGGVVGPQDTDGSGMASFPGIAAGSYSIAVTKDGYSDGSGSANVSPNQSNAASVALTPWTVTLTVDGVADGDKATVGGLIVRNFDGNNAPRKKITISAVTPAGVTGKVTLQCDSAKVKFFDAVTGGSQIALDGAANVFAAGSLPKDVFAEGADASDSMRDINVWLDIASRTKVDAATLTVLWLDKPVVNLSGTISPNNAKKAGYTGWTKSGTADLGLQEYNATFGARMGWGSEASAKVNPTKFKYPGSDLKLERDFDFNDFDGSNNVQASGTHSASMPPGNDTGPASARDDDPDPDDTIYDWDAAGLGIPNLPANTINRTRNNMIAFASITVEGKSVRCSENTEYFISFSMVQTSAPSGSTWIKKDPPDVAGDNQAGNGTTKTTWDLK